MMDDILVVGDPEPCEPYSLGDFVLDGLLDMLKENVVEPAADRHRLRALRGEVYDAPEAVVLDYFPEATP